MDVSEGPEHTGGIRRILVPAIFCAVLLFSSCSPENVLSVSDPYIEALEGKHMKFINFMFVLKSRMHGFRITEVRAEPEHDLAEILSEYPEQAGIVVISPWNSLYLRKISRNDGQLHPERRFIIAGGYKPENLPRWLDDKVSEVVPDRIPAMEKAAEIAADAAERTGRPALALFNATTDSLEREKAAIVESFGSSILFISEDLSEVPEAENQLPAGFSETAEKASILLLFAGPLNIEALTVTDEYLTPVITEYLDGSAAWEGRMVCSVEDNPSALRSALLSEMRLESPDGTRYYDAKLAKGVLFASEGR